MQERGRPHTGLPLSRAGNPPLGRLHSRLPAVIAAGDLSGDGHLDDHLTDHTSIYVGNGGIVHVSNYYEYGKVVLTEMRYLDVLWGGKRFRLR
jgi:hypothetical protein